jgi:hypothetical protein
MSHSFSVFSPVRFAAGIMLFTSVWSLQAWAQEQEPTVSVPSVQVTGARINGEEPYAEVPYGPYIRDYSFLRKQLPRESRLIEMWEMFHYASMSAAQQDAYMPPRDGIAIVSQSVKATVPVRRGGYFILPQVAQAYLEEGTIQVRQAIDRQYHTMYIAFSLHLDPDQRTSYADLGKASRQIDAVLGKISPFHQGLKHIRQGRHDAIKACFLDDGSSIRVAGQAVADGVRGNCKILALDPARVASGEAIEFSGALDIVTFVDRRDYGL